MRPSRHVRTLPSCGRCTKCRVGRTCDGLRPDLACLRVCARALVRGWRAGCDPDHLHAAGHARQGRDSVERSQQPRVRAWRSVGFEKRCDRVGLWMVAAMGVGMEVSVGVRVCVRVRVGVGGGVCVVVGVWLCFNVWRRVSERGAVSVDAHQLRLFGCHSFAPRAFAAMRWRFDGHEGIRPRTNHHRHGLETRGPGHQRTLVRAAQDHDQVDDGTCEYARSCESAIRLSKAPRR
eukprot:4245501-Pleurochrysis_carterae.AAC.1